jgi:twitching motility protein PilI
MANRQALRELQTRLAERLQVARTEGVAAAWLAVEAGGQKYLFPLSQSGEIFPWVSAQPVPYTQAWFVGVANLRGGLFGVVDLARFANPAAPSHRTELSHSDARLVALNSALDVNCALLVDRLAGLRKQDAFADFAAKHDNSPDFFGNQYIDHVGERWQEINLQTLARQDHFLTISA